MSKKNILSSKTFWFNFLFAVGYTATELASRGSIDPKLALYIIAGCNLILRIFTEVPVTIFKK